MAMITTMCLLGDPARFNDGLMLRSAYMNMENCIKAALKQGAPTNEEKGFPFVRTLPSLPGSLSPEIMRAAYDDGDGPAPSLPQGVRMHELMQLKSTIPLRANRLTLQLQVPKAAPLPFMMHGMQMGNPFVNQFTAQFSNMMAAGMQQAVAAAAFQANPNAAFQANPNVSQPSRPVPALEGPAPLEGPALQNLQFLKWWQRRQWRSQNVNWPLRTPPARNRRRQMQEVKRKKRRKHL